MKLFLEISDAEKDNLLAFLSEHNGKVLKNGTDISFLYFTPQDAASALRVAGIKEKVLVHFSRERVILDVLRKVKDSFDADIAVNYDKFLLIAQIVALDYNERVALIEELSNKDTNYDQKKELIHEGIKPIDVSLEAEVNELRVALWEAFVHLSSDIRQFLKIPSEDAVIKIQAGLELLQNKETEIDNRLVVSPTIVDKEGVKAIFYPTVMPFDFEREQDYLFASVSGFDSLKYFLENLYALTISDFDLMKFKRELKTAMNDFSKQPFGGKAAILIKGILSEIAKNTGNMEENN